MVKYNWENFTLVFLMLAYLYLFITSIITLIGLLFNRAVSTTELFLNSSYYHSELSTYSRRIFPTVSRDQGDSVMRGRD